MPATAMQKIISYQEELPSKRLWETSTRQKNKQQAAKDKKQRELEQAKEFAARLENKTVTIKARAGDSGKLFGAISGKDIADAIKSQYDAEVDKKKIVLHEPIKTAGEHQLEIRVYAGVTVNINVNIVI